MKRPHTTVVLAMSADGKIADRDRSAARFASPRDKSHLEGQIARADAVLFGAGTLRAYQTSLSITHPALLQQRQARHQPPQPIHLVVSASGRLNPDWRFFRQDFPRWLLTTPQGARRWPDGRGFDRILPGPLLPPEGAANPAFDWPLIFEILAEIPLPRLAVLGGGELVAALFAADLIDELWLTVCPLILGGALAPSPVEGLGFPADRARLLQLCEATPVAGEVFLRYRVQY